MTPKTTFIPMDDNASIEERIEALLRAEGEVTVRGIRSTLVISAEDAFAILEKFVSEGKAEKGIKYQVQGAVYSYIPEETRAVLNYLSKKEVNKERSKLDTIRVVFALFGSDGLTAEEIESHALDRGMTKDETEYAVKTLCYGGEIYKVPSGKYRRN